MNGIPIDLKGLKNADVLNGAKYIDDVVDEQIQKMTEDMSEAERNSTYLNVNLIYGGD